MFITYFSDKILPHPCQKFTGGTIEKSAPALLGDLNPDDVVPYLVGDEALTRDDVEEIESRATRRKKVQTLLDIIPRRGAGAYVSLWTAWKKLVVRPICMRRWSARKRNYQHKQRKVPQMNRNPHCKQHTNIQMNRPVIKVRLDLIWCSFNRIYISSVESQKGVIAIDFVQH